jgi:hypothetical protein
MSILIPPFTAAEKARAASRYLATKNGESDFRKQGNARRWIFPDECRLLKFGIFSLHKNQGIRILVDPKNQLSQAREKN